MKLWFANFAFGWMWLLLGFASGMVLGMFFQREEWLGGYASFSRRLYRLGHISFFGLGTLNLLFYFSARDMSAAPVLSFVSWAMIIGGLAMPLCCLIVASWPKLKMIFAIPVVSLLAGGILMLMEVIHL